MQGHAALLHQCLPGRDVRVMFEYRDDDLIAGSERPAESTRQVIDHRRRVRTKNDFISGSVEEIGKRVARAFDNRVGLMTRRIFPVSVRVVIQQIVGDRIDDYLRCLGSARRVKICGPVSVVLPPERRKLGANLFGRDDPLRRC